MQLRKDLRLKKVRLAAIRTPDLCDNSAALKQIELASQLGAGH